MDVLTWIRNQWDRVGAWALVALGAIALVLGWVGVTGTPYTFEQIPYVISGGLGGIFLLGVGAMLWISADLRDEWRKLDRLLELYEERHGTDQQPHSTDEEIVESAVELEGDDDAQAGVGSDIAPGAPRANGSAPARRRRSEPARSLDS